MNSVNNAIMRENKLQFKINKKRFFTITFILYALIVLVVSSYPSLEVPFKLPSKFLQPDKLAHFVQYFIFAFLYYLMRKYHEVRQKDILIELFFLGMLIPIIDELHQIPIPGRTFEWYDVIADILGFFLFIIIKIFINKTIRRTNGNH